MYPLKLMKYIQNYNIGRQAQQYKTPLCRTNIKQHTIPFKGPLNIWISLPSNNSFETIYIQI